MPIPLTLNLKHWGMLIATQCDEIAIDKGATYMCL